MEIRLEGDAGEVELIASTATAVGLTSTTYFPTSGIHAGMMARSCLIEAIGFDINFTLNGTTPTITAGTNKGIVLAAGQNYTLTDINNIKNFKCINAADGSGATVKAIPFF